ncbi:MAG TPA: phosphoribosyl-AMP cyclohydrolase [Pyrodictium sp.]|nr:phosphoribosyl-AMP cyclohydrolase [Pyrodictium sp.]
MPLKPPLPHHLAEKIANKLNYRHQDSTVIAVVQEATTNQVLMVASMNREAVILTLTTGYAHFWSLSRKKVWMKGETSGNKLRVIDVIVDCDLDALLLRVEPLGPTCHTLKWSCFHNNLDMLLKEFEGKENHTRKIVV